MATRGRGRARLAGRLGQLRLRSQEARLPQSLADGHALRLRLVLLLRQVRQLIHVVHEQQVGTAQMDFILRSQLPFGIEANAIDARTVEAVEVADTPTAAAETDLSVLAAAQVVLEDDAIGRGPAQSVGLASNE